MSIVCYVDIIKIMSENRVRPFTFGPSTMLDSFFDDMHLGNSFRTIDTLVNQTYPDAFQLQRNRHFKLDVVEKADGYTVDAELPGITKENINVDVKNNVLSIKATRNDEKNDDTDTYHYRERSYGSVSRSFRLPNDAVTDNITCKYENGILSVNMPKVTVSDASRKIKVN